AGQPGGANQIPGPFRDSVAGGHAVEHGRLAPALERGRQHGAHAGRAFAGWLPRVHYRRNCAGSAARAGVCAGGGPDVWVQGATGEAWELTTCGPMSGTRAECRCRKAGCTTSDAGGLVGAGFNAHPSPDQALASGLG
nr:hypothetical protein [Tanacetum cinerariifolium]